MASLELRAALVGPVWAWPGPRRGRGERGECSRTGKLAMLGGFGFIDGAPRRKSVRVASGENDGSRHPKG